MQSFSSMLLSAYCYEGSSGDTWCNTWRSNAQYDHSVYTPDEVAVERDDLSCDGASRHDEKMERPTHALVVVVHIQSLAGPAQYGLPPFGVFSPSL